MRVLWLALLVASCESSSGVPDASGNDAGSDAPSVGKANGTVGPWQTLAPMPNPRANFCATVAGSYVVVVGGNFPGDGGFVKLDAVHVARFHDDGSLDAWQLAGHAPSPVTECTVTASGSTIYLLDGIYDDVTLEGHVFSADLAQNGTLATFALVAQLPAGVDLFDNLAFTVSGRLFATTSKLTGSCALVSGALGNLTPWANTDWLPEFRGRPQWANATAGGTTFVYVLGGYSDADSGNTTLATGDGASVAQDGTTGTSFSVTPLPKPTTFGTAASADDYVFVIGGRDMIFGAKPTTDVVSAQASSSGALGTWSVEPSLPAARSNMSAVVAGSFLYVLGGADSAATDTVYAARVRF